MTDGSGKMSQTITVSTWTIVKIVLVFLFAWLLWYLRGVIAILVLSILLAALIDPFATWFAKHKIPRGLAVVIVYLVLFLLSALVVILLIPALLEQVGQLAENFSATYDQAVEWLGFFHEFSVEHGLGENFTASITSLQDQLIGQVENVFSTITGVLIGIGSAVVVFALSYYMVVEEDKAKRFVRNLAPPEYQPFLAQLFTKMQVKIGAWLRGQLILGFVVGLAVYIGLRILGVQYALVLAIVAGLFEIVPYIGPLIATVPAVIIGFSSSIFMGIAVIILYLIIQQIENNVLVPKVMQKVTGLNPIVSIVALLIGFKVSGVLGAILAIPLATMLSVVLEELFNEFSFFDRK